MRYISLYLGAVVLANLTVAWFGPGVTVINAFVLIGLDLTSRDKLHDAWKGRGLVWKMALLILAGSVISYALNQGAGRVALASLAAFAVSAGIDTLVYHLLGGRVKFVRVNGSNLFSAAADSLIFPTVAFGSFLPWIVLGQFAAKVVGGFIWSLILHRERDKAAEAA